MNTKIAALLSGLVFGIGLSVSGMTLPEKVIGFLDVAGDWDPALMFVMGGALLTYAIGFRLITKRTAPMFAPQFYLPTRRDIDGRLIGGAVLFGVGWGLGGYCPGPAITSVASASLSAVYFVGAMLAGMAIQHAVSRAMNSSRQGGVDQAAGA